ncbi:hypothetical protein HYT84_00900 [Candidatus Micrarchaeota archaeon]|nr:hypothetical protein [Candidatus Micrarchaeota archaeon]
MTGVVPAHITTKIRSHPHVEGPAVTPEERERFRKAVGKFNERPEGSLERVEAIGTIYPFILRMVRTKEKEGSLTHSEREGIEGKKAMMEGMVEELLEACKGDVEVRLKAFGALVEISNISNYVMVRPFVTIANNNDDTEMRFKAIRAVYELLLREEHRNTYVTIGKDRMPVSHFLRKVLLDLARNGTYADVRSEVVKCFTNSKDSATLRAIHEGSKFKDTKEEAFKARMDVEEGRRKATTIDPDEILGALGDDRLTRLRETQVVYDNYAELKEKARSGASPGKGKLKLVYSSKDEEPEEPPPSPAMAAGKLDKEGEGSTDGTKLKDAA